MRLWDPASGREMAQLPLGALECVAIGPSGAPIACGDSGGSVHLVEVAGLELGPLVVTATDFGEGLVVRCPHCNVSHTFDRECSHCRALHTRHQWLGKEIASYSRRRSAWSGLGGTPRPRMLALAPRSDPVLSCDDG